ncbi:MAG TPA: LysR family transcriptional regulator [Aliidongia sp.]|nr:LysR family transcriptional regulator [Aliidongia sp.]
MLTLIQLRCFLAVVDKMNFRRAAAALNMTQPPLTRQIQGLEHEVGVQLIDRSSRAIRLTPAGEAFARSAGRILDAAADATEEARRIARGDAGSLTIGFTAASGYVFLPRFVALLRTRLPGLALSLRELTTPQQVAALRSGQLDLGLLRPPVSGLRSMPVYREALVLAVPSGHRLATAPDVTLQDLATETLITYPPVEGPYFHNLIMGLLHMAGVSPAGVQHVTQTHSILALVGGGLGVALVPRSAERFLPPEVAVRPVSGLPDVGADLVLAWPGAPANPARDAVLDLLRREGPPAL